MIRTLLSGFVVGVTLAASAAATAGTPAGTFSVRGAGLIDCATYLTEQQKQSPAYMMMGGWMDGYITGVNQYAPDTYDATSFESTELFAELVKNYCKDHPQVRLFAVMNSIVQQIWGRRITQPSPLVTVRLGEQHVQLYRETILRIQQQLREKGLLKSEPTGQFDAATVTALSEFQKTLKGYKASGFPDQATLFQLFAQETPAPEKAAKK